MGPPSRDGWVLTPLGHAGDRPREIGFPGTSEKFCTPERYRLCKKMVVSTRKNRWFVKCEPPSDAAIAAVLQKISHRVIRTLRRLGYLEAGMDAAVATAYDPLLDNEPELARTMAASVTQRIAFGERAGEKVRRIGSGFGYEGERPALTGPRCASVQAAAGGWGAGVKRAFVLPIRNGCRAGTTACSGSLQAGSARMPSPTSADCANRTSYRSSC